MLQISRVWYSLKCFSGSKDRLDWKCQPATTKLLSKVALMMKCVCVCVCARMCASERASENSIQPIRDITRLQLFQYKFKDKSRQSDFNYTISTVILSVSSRHCVIGYYSCASLPDVVKWQWLLLNYLAEWEQRLPWQCLKRMAFKWDHCWKMILISFIQLIRSAFCLLFFYLHFSLHCIHLVRLCMNYVFKFI